MPRGGTPAADQQRLNFPERIRGSRGVGGIDRHVGDDRAGSFVEPDLRQPHHVGALRSGKTAARMTDEDHDGSVGFLDHDRMPQAVIVRNARRHFLVVRASAEHDGETGEHSSHTEERLRSTGIMAVIVVLVPPQSVMKP